MMRISRLLRRKRKTIHFSTGDDDKFSTATSRLSTVLQKRTWSSLCGFDRFDFQFDFDRVCRSHGGYVRSSQRRMRSKHQRLEPWMKTRRFDTLPNGAELEALPDELDEEAEDQTQPQLLTRIEIVESN